MFKREHLRGITVFFGIGEERPYYVEKTPSLLAERLRHNMTFFYLNYLAIASLLFCLTLFTSIRALLGIAVLALCWMWVIRSSQDGSLRVASTFVRLFHQRISESHIIVLRSLPFICTRRQYSSENSRHWNGRNLNLCLDVSAVRRLLVGLVQLWDPGQCSCLLT
jgi:PRA1 family protein